MVMTSSRKLGNVGVPQMPTQGKMNAGGAGSLPGLPNLGGLLGGGQQQAKPLTTVVNGQAGSYVNGKFVPQGSGGSGGAPRGGMNAGGQGSINPLNLTNFAQKDPNIENANKLLSQRFDKLSAGEGQADPFLMESVGNLRNRQSADTTQRATDRATSAIRNMQAGQEQAALANKARSGQGGGGRGLAAERAQRLQAGAAANIALGRERDLDALALGGHNILAAPGQRTLQQQGLTNQALGTLAGNAGAAGQLALGQQGLGLDAWKAANNFNLEKQRLDQQSQLAPYGLAGAQLDLYGKYLNLLNSAGY